MDMNCTFRFCVSSKASLFGLLDDFIQFPQLATPDKIMLRCQGAQQVLLVLVVAIGIAEANQRVPQSKTPR